MNRVTVCPPRPQFASNRTQGGTQIQAYATFGPACRSCLPAWGCLSPVGVNRVQRCDFSWGVKLGHVAAVRARKSRVQVGAYPCGGQNSSSDGDIIPWRHRCDCVVTCRCSTGTHFAARERTGAPAGIAQSAASLATAMCTSPDNVVTLLRRFAPRSGVAGCARVCRAGARASAPARSQRGSHTRAHRAPDLPCRTSVPELRDSVGVRPRRALCERAQWRLT